MRSRACGGWRAAVLLVILASGCATISPSQSPPPKAFESDGCSVFPDGDYRTCCDAHDRAYWCGGTPEQRRSADRTLAECVERQGHGAIASLMHLGVRIGGVPWLPTTWRWGFGWRFGRPYTDSPQLQCAVHDR
jgi:hypothetical protein